ncbi:hypothetical protein SAMN05444000_11142 [Shimia gijangensis]|uniref:Uncharacterized protein n=1 Tax=Shimia gijangensis TaxID=1470563 RepID=A0A1M6L019_9RHOB|nr:hypothetical protein [Shimia gijangensis]SHJ64507.1 hypothetical protein SAMN05444000_11142 [Shimia gijangensis]
MTLPLNHNNQGRNKVTVLGLAAAVLVLAFLQSVGTMPWLLIMLGLFAVPAAIDVIRNPKTQFSLTEEKLSWKNSGQTAELPLARIESARFDTRWDFSVRVTLTLIDKSKLRIPQDVMPYHATLEKEFEALNIPTERQHFRVI